MNSMTLEQAKSIHGAVMKVLMAQRGIGEITDEHIERLKSTKLVEMLTSNEIMTGYKEDIGEGRTRTWMVTTEESIAELYCRLHSADFYTLEDVKSLAEAYEQVVEDSENGFGVLIDSGSYFTLVALNSDGTAGEDITYEHSFSALYKWVGQKVSEVAA